MRRFGLATGAMLLAIAPTLALDGQPAMHDPSTVIGAGGKFYVYATGNGLPAFQSDDGWTGIGPARLCKPCLAASLGRTSSRAAATIRGRPTSSVPATNTSCTTLRPEHSRRRP